MQIKRQSCTTQNLTLTTPATAKGRVDSAHNAPGVTSHNRNLTRRTTADNRGATAHTDVQPRTTNVQRHTVLFVAYLAIVGRESQSEPAGRVTARAYMHMLPCMSDVDSSKSYQFPNQISKCLNVMIFRM